MHIIASAIHEPIRKVLRTRTSSAKRSTLFSFVRRKAHTIYHSFHRKLTKHRLVRRPDSLINFKSVFSRPRRETLKFKKTPDCWRCDGARTRTRMHASAGQGTPRRQRRLCKSHLNLHYPDNQAARGKSVSFKRCCETGRWIS